MHFSYWVDLRQEIAVHQKKEESSNSVDDSDIRTAESDVRITANQPGSPGGSCSLAAEQLSNRQHNALTENYSNSFQSKILLIRVVEFYKFFSLNICPTIVFSIETLGIFFPKSVAFDLKAAKEQCLVRK